MFVPLDIATKKTSGVVTSGKYQIPEDIGLLPGNYRVEVLDDPPLHAPSGSGNQSAAHRRRFPRHYGHESLLRAEIPKDNSASEMQLNFDLKLHPEKK